VDASSKGILYFVHISKRRRISIRKRGMKEEFKFWGLLQLHEIGHLLLWNLRTPRSLGVLWRRRAEILAMARSVVGRGRFEPKAVPEVY
jgi:hypothetical protein